jgi:hypothetical protein
MKIIDNNEIRDNFYLIKKKEYQTFDKEIKRRNTKQFLTIKICSLSLILILVHL